MCITRNVVGLIVIAAMAFAAGRSNLFTSTVALAQQPAGKETGRAKDKDKDKDKAQAPSAEIEAMHQAMERFGNPGPNHRHLEPAIGTFDAIVRFRMDGKSDWMESKGTVKREWVLGNRYIHETVNASGFGPDAPPFEAIGYLGYNNYDGQYEMAWMENHSTAIVFESGSYDPEKKVMTMRSSHRNVATGRLMNGHGTWDMSNPDRQTYNGFTVGDDGREFKSFEGVFERVKR